MKIKSILVSVLVGVALSCSAKVNICKAHKDEALFENCQLKVDGQNVDVYQCRVSKYPINQVWPGYQRPIQQTELSGFAYWETDGKSEIEIVAKEQLKNVVVRPLSLGIKPKIDGNKITFTLEKIKPIVVEMNSPHNIVHLFPNPILKDAPQTKTKGFCCPQCNYCSPILNEIPDAWNGKFYHFQAGIHDVGTLILKSNDTVYIEAGAVVYGSLVADNADNIRVFGRGILDGANTVRANKWARGGFGNLHFRNCTNLKIDGIILRDPNSWGVNIRRCKNVEISNLKFIGYWRYNSDGIDFWDSENIVMKDCFIRAYDDSIIVRSHKLPNRNIRVSDCVIWNDWGLSITVEADPPVKIVNDIHFENMDIIRSSSSAMLILNTAGIVMHNLRYKNINVEYNDWHARQIHQKKENPEELYVPDFKSNYLPPMINVCAIKRPNHKKVFPSLIDDVVFENINLYGNEKAPIRFKSMSEQCRVGNVLIKNLKFNGRVITDLKQTNLKIDKFSDKVKLEQ